MNNYFQNHDTDTDNLTFLFIDTDIWKLYSINNAAALFQLGKKYHLVFTSSQLKIIMRSMFRQHLNKIELLTHSKNKDHIIELFQLNAPEFMRNYILFSTLIKQFIYYIIPVSKYHVRKAHIYSIMHKAPFSHTYDLTDTVSWIALLESKQIPIKSNLLIYSDDLDFKLDNILHPQLFLDWKTEKHGNIYLYSPKLDAYLSSESDTSENKILE